MSAIRNTDFLISAAGGNTTAIRVVENPPSRRECEEVGVQMMDAYAQDGVEQAGVLHLASRHFEMAGGEFCGNATRAAALLYSMLLKSPTPEFTVSGYEGSVRSDVQSLSANTYRVTCVLDRMTARMTETVIDGQPAKIVDLGGIVHVLIEGNLPADYKSVHRRITEELGLSSRDAVGVCWVNATGDSVVLKPVVWVRAIDKMFYESSCGSGSIAAALATGARDITQPSGKDITVVLGKDGGVTLTSEMEVLNA